MTSAPTDAPFSGDFNEVVQSPVSGDAVIRGVVASDNTGWFSTTYRNYNTGQAVFSGTVTVTKRNPNAAGPRELDADFEYSNFSVDTATVDFQISGTATMLKEYDNTVRSDSIQATFVVDDLNSNFQQKIENADISRQWTTTVGSEFFGLYENAKGRVFNSNHGYVDYTTPEPLHLQNELSDPVYGGHMLIDDGSFAATVLPLNDSIGVAVLYDQDGDGVNDSSTRVTWRRFYGDTENLPTNQAPPTAHIMPYKNVYASVGYNVDIKVGETASLSGFFSVDPNLTFVGFDWELVRVPPNSNASMIGISKPVLEFTADAPGRYLLKLTVSDGIESSTDYLSLDAWLPEYVTTIPPVEGALNIVSSSRRISLGETVEVKARTHFQYPTVRQTGYGWSLRKYNSLDDGLSASTSKADFAPTERGFYNLQGNANGKAKDQIAILVDSPVHYLSHFEFEQAEQSSEHFFGDFNGDNRPDLAVIERDPISNENLVMFLYDDGDSFAATGPTIGVGPGFINSGSTTDIDNDGMMDIVLRSQNDVSIVYGFSSQQNPRVLNLVPDPGTLNTGLSSKYDVIADDIDGDGRADITLIQQNTRTFSIARQSDQGTFPSWVNYVLSDTVAYGELQAADVTDDGITDILVYTREDNVLYMTTYPSVDGSLPGTPSKQAMPFGEFLTYSLVAMDVNLDGAADLVFRGYDDLIEMVNDGAGVFSVGKTTLDVRPSEVALLDVTGDNIPELLMSDRRSLEIFEATPTGLSDPFELPLQMTEFVGVADVNQDGIPDLLTHRFPKYFGLSLSAE